MITSSKNKTHLRFQQIQIFSSPELLVVKTHIQGLLDKNAVVPFLMLHQPRNKQ